MGYLRFFMKNRTGQTSLGMLFLILTLSTLLSCGTEDNQGSLPTNQAANPPAGSPVTSHQFLWQADGSGPARGQASIHNWPRLTGGTAACDLSQVSDNTSLPQHAPFAGSPALHYIQAKCIGGSSGGRIEIVVDMDDRTMSDLGNFGFFWHQPSVSVSTAVTLELATSPSFSQYFRFNWATGAVGRRLIDGWNPITWQAGDHVGNVGGAAVNQTFTIFRILLDLRPNSSGTFYISDFLHGYYAKPQINIWGENNFVSVYTHLFPEARKRNLIGSYCPVTEMLKDPGRVELEGGFTNDQLKEMVAAGWTIGGESTEGLNYIDFHTLESAAADMDQHLTDLQRLGYQRPIFWCYEDAKHNAALDAELAKRSVVAAYSGNVFSDNTSRSLYGGLTNPYNLWAVSGDARSLTEIIAAIDHAVKYGGQLGLEWQRYDQDFPPVADYLVKLRAEGKIEIVTVEDMIARHGIKSGSPLTPPPAGPPPPTPPPAGPPPAALLPFDQVERSFTQTAGLFSGLWAQARTRTVRIALLGDSQETAPEGKGDVYVPRLQYEAWKRYQNVPETVVSGYHSFGGGAPYGDWLLRGAAARPGASPTRITSERHLPGIPTAAHAAPAGAQSVNGQQYGQLIVLEPDARSLNPAAEIPTANQYFCTQGSVRAEVFAATHPQSGGILYKARPSDVTPRYSATATVEETAPLSLVDATFIVKSFTTVPLPFNGQPYLQLEILGSMTSNLTDIIGARFKSDQCPHGLVIQDLSAGGLSTKEFLSTYRAAGFLFRAMGFDAAVLHFGANDIGEGSTAELFRADTERLIARIRSWSGKPDFPIILMSDPYRKGLSQTSEVEYARYPGALRAIAASDPAVLVINSRRLMDERGWKADQPNRLSEVLLDNVHYTPRGAIELAEEEMKALLGP
ncbi:MAG: GDSL-type esterase/lipase family protein [Nitrospira sp.]